jgi:hypothetical protein
MEEWAEERVRPPLLAPWWRNCSTDTVGGNRLEGHMMIVELFHGVRWLDLMIHRKLGLVYNTLLGIGLIVEIVRQLREAHNLQGPNMIRTALAVALFVVLLLHQLAELADHVDRRFRKSKQIR